MKYFKQNSNGIYLYGILSGVLLGISFPPIPLPYFVFFALVPYLFILEKKDGLAEINKFTYVTMFAFNLITLYWVGSWSKEADPFLMISGAALLFFNPALYLIPSSLYYVSKKFFPKKVALFLFPIFWTTFEFLYSVTEARFPWLTLGNSLPYFKSYIQIADIVGVYGLSLLILYSNIFIYLTFLHYKSYRKIHFGYSSAALLILIFPVIYGFIKVNNFKRSDEKVQVGLIQPNLNPWNKWEEGNLDSQIDLYFELSRHAVDEGAELLLWPETALPVYLLSAGYSDQKLRLKKFIDSVDVPLITGMPDANFFKNEEAPDYAKESQVSDYLYTSYNSILLFSPGNPKVQKYGKIKLVPFGERVPFVDQIPFMGELIKWNVGISSWNVGRDTTIFKVKLDSLADSLSLSGVVCIESIYPDFVAQFVKKNSKLIAVVTNDSWYGNSSGPYQHKAISVLRAVENGRTVVRAANGGISAIINPVGEIIAQTEMFEREVLVGDAYLYSDLTFFSRYPLLIPYITVIISLFYILNFLFAQARLLLNKKRNKA